MKETNKKSVLEIGSSFGNSIRPVLKLIEEIGLLNPDGIVFLHDIGWPYGRRDMYYDSDTVPSEFRNPYAKRGIQKGRSLLLDDGGFNSGLNNAISESAHGIASLLLSRII